MCEHNAECVMLRVTVVWCSAQRNGTVRTTDAQLNQIHRLRSEPSLVVQYEVTRPNRGCSFVQNMLGSENVKLVEVEHTQAVSGVQHIPWLASFPGHRTRPPPGSACQHV